MTTSKVEEDMFPESLEQHRGYTASELADLYPSQPVTYTGEGMKFDTDKVRMELLPVEAMVGTAKVLTFGAKKYADRNWEKGIKYSRVYGAMLRHMTAWWAGENEDPETGLSHLHHAACCVTFLQTYSERMMGDELDDRP